MRKEIMLKTSIVKLLHKNKLNKKVAIISNDKYKNKLTDDLLLKLYLIKNNIYADILSYESDDISGYDAIIIRSLWGYQDDLGGFEKFLDNANKKNIKIFNNSDILRNNYNKDIQFDILNKNNINTVETKFIKNMNDLSKYVKSIKNKSVIKPIISGSGNNTYVIDGTCKNSIKVDEIVNKFKNVKCGVMLQPFMEEISDGEYSLIYIDGKLLYGVKRYTGIFNDKFEVFYIPKDKLDKEFIELGDKILKIKEYKDSLYARVDAIKKDNSYIIMETEFVEPDLFIRKIPDKKYKDYVLNFFADSIKKMV